MFDKLVVSTNERRKARVARFFAGTSLVYASGVAAALVLSVALSSPKLADSGSTGPSVTSIAPQRQSESSRDRDQRSSSRAPSDPNNVRTFDDISRGPQTTSPQTSRGQLLPNGPLIDVPFNEGGGPGTGRGPGFGPPGLAAADRSLREAVPPAPTPAPQPRAETDMRPVPITSKVLQGKALERPAPDYPPLAKRIRLEGDVLVEVIVSPEGAVESVRAISGHPLLVNCSLSAARRWRFMPTLLNGVPVRVNGVITFVFRLQ